MQDQHVYLQHDEEILADLIKEARGNISDISAMARFFKTDPGQYGEGDEFLGIKVPVIRSVAKKYKNLSTEDIQKVLESPKHEMRLLAVIIMANQSVKGDAATKLRLYQQYLASTKYVNSWDIVDSSCRDVVGGYLLDHPEEINVLERLAQSDDLWERRIAMVSTWQFIRVGQTDQTYKIAAMLLSDKHDLIHKAVGWMLREAGKRNELQLKEYLEQYAPKMPRMTLRYAIERLSTEDRRHFMSLA